jgi:hypothetical protein
MSVRRILHSDLNLHPYTLQTVYSLNDRDEEFRLQFSRHFQGILTDNPDLPNKLLMRQIFIFMAQFSMLVSCKSSRPSSASPLQRMYSAVDGLYT